jgi:ribosome-associated protein
MDIRKLQRAIIDGLEDVKAQRIVVFNTEDMSPLFERVIVASGNSNRQTKALASSVREAVKAQGFEVMSTEGEDNGEWIIVDCGAAVVHVMQPGIRDYYNLEEIWGAKPVRLRLAGEAPTRLVKASEDSSAALPAKKAAARKVAAKDAVAKKTAAKTGAAKAPVAKRAVAKKAAAQSPSAKAPGAEVAAAPSSAQPKPAAKKLALKKPAVKEPAGKEPAPAAKPSARRAPAKKAPAKTAPAKTAPAKTVAAEAAPAKAAPAKRAPAKAATARKKAAQA